MKPAKGTLLSRLDDSVRWTGFPARVADQMSDASDHKHRPLRWIPMWPIAFSCVPFVVVLAWPELLDGISPAALIGVMVSFMGAIAAMAPGIHMYGPLGKPWLEDDEREVALRKDSLLFCTGLLAFLNCLGQPTLMILSQWQDWPTVRSYGVAASAFMLNATLFACLPTLYVSWKLEQLPKE